MLLVSLAVLTLVALVAFAIEAGIGSLRIPHLSRVPPASGDDLPSVSLIIAGRNEADRVQDALHSVLALDYPHLEIVFVDDRSTDGTGEKAREVAREDGRVHIVRNDELPDGWLGKNWALHLGARAAKGTLLLFTDADVHFDPSTLRRAVRVLEERKLDHLAATPSIKVSAPLVAMFVSAFGLSFSIYARPWKASTSKSARHHIGIGAFNLVCAELYRKAGGHEPIRMRPDDDMKLGKLLKREGARQAMAYASGVMEVEWYRTFREALTGLEKNSFSAVDYKLTLMIFASVFQVAMFVWPFVALLFTSGLTWMLNLVIVLLLYGMVAGSSFGVSGAKLAVWGLFFPLGILLLQFTIWRATIKTLSQGGIRWRETFYPLAQLRANRI